MARPKLPNPTRARIVVNAADARSDKFIALRLAETLLASGELVEIDLGPSYPHSYAPARGQHITGATR